MTTIDDLKRRAEAAENELAVAKELLTKGVETIVTQSGYRSGFEVGVASAAIQAMASEYLRSGKYKDVFSLLNKEEARAEAAEKLAEDRLVLLRNAAADYKDYLRADDELVLSDHAILLLDHVRAADAAKEKK